MEQEQQLEFDHVLYKLHTELKALKALLDVCQDRLPDNTVLLANKLMKDLEK